MFEPQVSTVPDILLVIVMNMCIM